MTQAKSFLHKIPFIQKLGVEFVSAANGRSVVALDLTDWHMNSWAVAHGGVLLSLLDVAMAVAAWSLDPGAEGGITVEMKTSFLQPAKAGSRLIASGHAFHSSRTLAFCEGEIRNTDDRLIAKAMGTFKNRKKSEKRSGA